MAAEFIRHITLQTGHSRDCYASEISADALKFCHDLIHQCLATDGEKVAIRNFDGYYLTCGNVGGRTLLGSVWHGVNDSTPLVNFAVATKSRNSAIAWRKLHNYSTINPQTNINAIPPVPWLAASLEPGAVMYPDAMHWLGDFERCLAWAWVTYDVNA